MALHEFFMQALLYCAMACGAASAGRQFGQVTGLLPILIGGSALIILMIREWRQMRHQDNRDLIALVAITAVVQFMASATVPQCGEGIAVCAAAVSGLVMPLVDGTIRLYRSKCVA